jgi:hypothetical protein
MLRTVPKMARLVTIIASLLPGCATTGGDETSSEAPKWAAHGWLTPAPQGEPEVIGVYEDREDCEAALDDWLQRQVVGNPIHGECLPVDNR